MSDSGFDIQDGALQWQPDALLPKVAEPMEDLEATTAAVSAVLSHLIDSNRQLAAANEITRRVARTATEAIEIVRDLLIWAESYAILAGADSPNSVIQSDLRRTRAFLGRVK